MQESGRKIYLLIFAKFQLLDLLFFEKCVLVQIQVLKLALNKIRQKFSSNITTA